MACLHVKEVQCRILTLFIGGVLLKAKGLAILTVVRAGFLVTARGGSGIVIAKLNDDLVSAGTVRLNSSRQ